MSKHKCKDLEEAYKSLLSSYYRAGITIINEVMWGPEAEQAEDDIFNECDKLSRKYLNRRFVEEY